MNEGVYVKRSFMAYMCLVFLEGMKDCERLTYLRGVPQ